MSGGQPTKYRPKYCEMLIEHMKTGLSFESFAGVISVCKDTIYEWAKPTVQPAFSEAKRKAVALNLLWWEEAGIKGMFMGGKDNPFQASIYIFQMKNRHKWTDRQDVTTDGDKIENHLNVYLPKEDEE